MIREKQKIKEIIIVEGKYDKNTVSQVVDTLVIETSGFRLFSDRVKMDLIKELARARGIIILTDSDSAGFLIRNHIKGCVAPELIKHAYIPDIYGKEKRKAVPSREGKLGVEGMPPEVILNALRRAGATYLSPDGSRESKVTYGENSGTISSRQSKSGCGSADTSLSGPDRQISVTDLYSAGLTGRAGSSERRKKLLQALNFPEKMTSGALLDVLNVIFTKESFDKYISDLFSDSGDADPKEDE